MYSGQRMQGRHWSRGAKSYAHTDPDTDTINLCDPWFDNENFPSTSEMIGNCGDTGKTVEEFETPAATLLHEFLHTNVCEEFQAPMKAEGEVYGGEACAKFAKDDEDKALVNPDNWMLVTIGTYWDKTCNRRIKLGIPGAENNPFVSTSGPNPTKTPFEQGTCSLKLTQTTTDTSGANGQYILDAQMFDNSKTNSIGYDNVVASADNPLKLMSKLEDIMELKPTKDAGGMVYFHVGSQMWDTTKTDQSQVPNCKPSTDTLDPKTRQASKAYECAFVCTWGGGKSSDGTD